MPIDGKNTLIYIQYVLSFREANPRKNECFLTHCETTVPTTTKKSTNYSKSTRYCPGLFSHFMKKWVHY